MLSRQVHMVRLGVPSITPHRFAHTIVYGNRYRSPYGAVNLCTTDFFVSCAESSPGLQSQTKPRTRPKAALPLGETQCWFLTYEVSVKLPVGLELVPDGLSDGLLERRGTCIVAHAI